ncbi:methyltransferase domain-containing protein [Cohnella sp. CFH 77786]|uniref:class I SAM-dependent methyltransferase n=1 Tax=Cohnella sp. CFH 77786 TaxID=2662265 RepID=UPI001C608E98|nr:class I SAM-dependent methyltransferase [Cohnella sp. CFH 77786]MBW5446886.1 methyltransferase domain-containing protein [Cohnella sp. CFH 77786]
MANEQSTHWAAETYDRTMGFVSKYGEDVLEWLKPQAGERILDFGCGTGDLAAVIAESGAAVAGVDISPEMIERARNKYPRLEFHCADGTNWLPDDRYDAVFSNAALHWMTDAEAAVRTIADSLVPGGRLAAEFGGAGNVQSVIEALWETLRRRGRLDAWVMPWYFPRVGEYAALLERHGFEVRFAMLIDRPTRLDGADGMKNWLEMFGWALVPGAKETEKEEWFAETAERLRSKHYENGHWLLDYRRLRVLAVKRAE